LLPGQPLYELERNEESPSTTYAELKKKRMREWGNTAQSLLSGAIDGSRSRKIVTPRLAHATLSLAQIHMWLGQGQQAVALLEDKRLGPLTLVQRDSPAVFSREYVRETYKVTIRAYEAVGRRQDADGIRKKLAEINDSPDTEPLAIYEPSFANIEAR
jgi:hypothetical protein